MKHGKKGSRQKRSESDARTSANSDWPQPVKQRYEPHPRHKGAPVQVGPYTVFAGGTRDLEAEDLRGIDVLVALTNQLPPLAFGGTYVLLHAALQDFGGVPDNWRDFLLQKVIPLLSTGKKVLAYCAGSHGRTGTLIASLIALLEPETADPIQAARERHCWKAVETREQGEGIFALRGQALPDNYKEEFARAHALMTAFLERTSKR
jgi:hypothetical protein